MRTLFQDLRHGLRLVIRNRSLTLAVFLSLTLGIGSTAATFSLIDAFLLRPISVPESHRVLRLSSSTQADQLDDLSWPDLDDLSRRNRSFEGIATARNTLVAMEATGTESARMVLALVVNSSFFNTLHVEPQLGRTFRSEEDEVPARDFVAVISDGLWERVFGRDPGVLGKTIRLNAQTFTIIGVAPRSFSGVEPFVRPELYVPRMMTASLSAAAGAALNDRSARNVQAVARLRDGVSVEQARDDVQRISTELEGEYPETNRAVRLAASTQLDYKVTISPDNQLAAWFLLAIAVLVLGIACVNVVNLLLATASARMREISLRMAMGASRLRIVRQLLAESLITAVAGTLGGLSLATLSAGYIASLRIAANLPVSLDARVDSRVVLFAFAVGLTAGVLAGLVPAIRCSRGDLHGLMQSAGSRSVSAGRMWIRQGLVAAQVAVAFVVLVWSGLSMQSLRTARTSDPGFRTSGIVMMSFDPAMTGRSVVETKAFYDTLVRRLEAVPGVQSAALAQHIPLGISSSATAVEIAGAPLAPGERLIRVSSNTVTGGFFQTMGIPLVRGRAFDSRDLQGAPLVVVINEALAQKYWPGRDAIGQALRIDGPDGGAATVVGVARDSKYRDTDEQPLPFMYLPQSQSSRSFMTLVVAADVDSAAIVPVLRREILAVDAAQPVFAVTTMRDHFEQQALWGDRLVSEVISTVGGIGLVLGVLGLYGIIAYAVSQRAREIGIRMAVGATRRSVLGLVLRQGMRISGIGVALGLGLTFLLSPVTASLMTNINPLDPAVYAIVVVGLILVTGTASLIPARRAATIDPMRTLRDG